MRKKWKRSFVTALSMALAVGNCVPAMAAPTGWKESAAGWQYVNANGSVQKGWFQDTTGDWYFLDYNTGVMKTGWVQPTDGKWYFMDYHTGAMKTGWIKPMDGKWYYLNPVSNGTKGAMQTGWVQTPDKKWYYMDASGAMQTGTITVNNQVWTLDANGAWDGKAATSVTYVSSSSSGRRPSSSTTKPETPPAENPGDPENKNPYDIVKNDDGTINLIINTDEFNLETLKGEVAGKTIKELSIEADLKDKELSDLTVQTLTIKESVGNGDVTLNNVKVDGDTFIDGGSNTVKLKNCTLQKVFARKKVDKDSDKKPLHISFEGTSTVAGVEAEGGNLIVEVKEETIKIPFIITKVPIVLTGAGKVEEFKVDKPADVTAIINVVINVVVDRVVIVEEAKTEIEVKDVSAPAPVTPEGKPVEDVVLTGTGTVEGYHNVTLNANGGYWVVDDVEKNENKPEETKTVKLKDDATVGSVLQVDSFDRPTHDSKDFTDKWYKDKECTEEVSMDVMGSTITITLYAGWKDSEQKTPTVEIKSATVSGVAATVSKTTTGTAVKVSGVDWETVDVDKIVLNYTASEGENSDIKGELKPETTEVKVNEEVIWTFTPEDKAYKAVNVTIIITTEN